MSTTGEAGQGLSESVRKYRQSVFKLNYKIKKNAGRPKMPKPNGQPAIPATAAAKMAAASATMRTHSPEDLQTAGSVDNGCTISRIQEMT